MRFLKRSVFLIGSLLFARHLYSQEQKYPGIFYSDIARFWVVYDSLHTMSDSIQQQNLIQQLYLDRGTDGLKQLAAIRHWTPRRFRKGIFAYSAFWPSIRDKTLHVQQDFPLIMQILARYKELYHDFKAPEIYFTIGYTSTGGTTTQTQILIGTEIAVADSTTDATGFSPFLKAYFHGNKGIAHLVAHEITHTQQKGGDMEDRRKSNLLGFCIAEGMCDFMAERLQQQPLETPYILYGRNHEKEVWQKFKPEMHGKDIDNWLYNGGAKLDGTADLGYFMGYAVCKSYYEHAHDKSKAIHDIITLDLEDTAGLDRFLAASKYESQ